MHEIAYGTRLLGIGYVPVMLSVSVPARRGEGIGGRA
jgi:hypothetical protein